MTVQRRHDEQRIDPRHIGRLTRGSRSDRVDYAHVFFFADCTRSGREDAAPRPRQPLAPKTAGGGRRARKRTCLRIPEVVAREAEI
ncbi:hypothetical protein EVAR_86285_1 [Eumeta japonica]|uniref:Uncharacterized protein n=1 Tax=Eumeta variegata TaxID=151549 RepID=A0A4C1UC20_EUMVA|nr:hypothetical protein EVAR_86285_1 [Eumeta japonica]